MEQKAGLNPFEIRAGLKQGSPSWLWPIIGLNPFEIRAGLKQSGVIIFLGMLLS